MSRAFARAVWAAVPTPVPVLVLMLGLGLGLVAMPARAAAVDTPLDRFLEGLTSLRAAFTQTVTDAGGKQVDAGEGSLLVRRPGRFRWQYTPNDAGAQLLVADGRNLWFYDRELQQVTVKPAAAALSATPVVLLSGSAAEVHAAFTITTGAAHDGLDWVEVTPRSDSADFSRAQLGFHGAQLARLVIHDRLGQVVTLVFQRSERNARVAADELAFTPPAGADVIGKAQ